MGLPVELCVKLEQAVGVKPGQRPSYFQKIQISDIIIKALEDVVSDVVLDPANSEAVAEEIQANERNRRDAAKSVK